MVSDPLSFSPHNQFKSRATMVKLFCALVRVKGSAFSVDVDPSLFVEDLKMAIKAENETAF